MIIENCWRTTMDREILKKLKELKPILNMA